MFQASFFPRMLRIGGVLLLLASLLVQTPGATAAWQTPPPGTPPPVDNAYNYSNQPAPEVSAQPGLPADGSMGFLDNTLFGQVPAQYVAPETPASASGTVVPGATAVAITTGDGSAPAEGTPSSGAVDATIPEAAAPAAPSVAAPTQPFNYVPEMLDPALDPTRQGAANPEEVELAARLSGNLDDFNRPNGALGPGWTPKLGTISIAGNLAQTIYGNIDFNLSIYNEVGANEVEADISIQPGGGGVTQYSALILNYGAGADNIFIKVQDNDGDGNFDSAACYNGNNSGGFGRGFFFLPSTFTSAHMRIEVNAARTVTLSLTKINGGTGSMLFTCAGAPAFEGNQVGIGSYGGGRIDNVSTAAAVPFRMENFNTQDGPLGPDWRVHAGSISVRNKLASSSFGNVDNSLATYSGLGTNRVEGEVSLTPGGGVQYSGFVLNYDEGATNLFIKVQDNDGAAGFDRAFCYVGNNGSGGTFGPPAGYIPLSAPFNTAHMRVDVDAARHVTIVFSGINGGLGSQTYTCADAPAAEGEGAGIVSYGGGRIDNFQVTNDFQDNFNRANGSLGGNWTVRAATYNIVSSVAQGSGGTALATYDGLGSNSIEGDVSLNSVNAVQYSGFVLNYGAGVTNLFIKIQDNNGNGDFDVAACYLGNNDTGAPFGAGFFNLIAPFQSAHMKVSVDNDRVVTIIFSEINGGTGLHLYTCAGAPAAEGGAVGIVGFGGGRMDNVLVKRTFAQDSFNHANGALGPSWSARANNFTIVDQNALGGINPTGSGLATFNNVTAKQIEGDLSLSPVGAVQYAGFVLDYGAGQSNVFFKLQHQDANPGFEKGACYIGNNGGSFGLGIFDLAAPVNTAHVQVTVYPNRFVIILLTRINGGAGVQGYGCSGAPPAEGDAIGIVGYGGGRVDNVVVNDYVVTVMTYLPLIAR